MSLRGCKVELKCRIVEYEKEMDGLSAVCIGDNIVIKFEMRDSVILGKIFADGGTPEVTSDIYVCPFFAK